MPAPFITQQRNKSFHIIRNLTGEFHPFTGARVRYPQQPCMEHLPVQRLHARSNLRIDDVVCLSLAAVDFGSLARCLHGIIAGGKVRMSRQRHISIQEAAKRLGVSQHTVRLWLKSGRLKGGMRPVTVPRLRVDVSSLKTAQTAVCAWCGKPFRARRATRARFCSRAHSIKYFNRKAALRQRGK